MPIILTDSVPEVCKPPEGLSVKSLNLLVIRCSDFERSLEFYQSIGLRFSRFRVGGYKSTCAQALIPGPEFALTATDPGAEIPCLNLQLLPAAEGETTQGLAFGFFVSCVDKAVESGLAHGGDLLNPAADWPYGRIAAIADPDGNR